MKIDAYDNPDSEALLLAAKERFANRRHRAREVADSALAVGFLIAASLLALLARWDRPLSALPLVLVVIVWVTARQVSFPVADGWTDPTMLAFVPALFVLPTPIVPLVALLASALSAAPKLWRHGARAAMLPALVADSWYTLGPALVIVLAGAQRFEWSKWYVYLAAMCAQILFDVAGTLGRCSIGEGISPRVQMPLLTWIYLSDLALFPLGLAIGAVAVVRPGLVLLALSPVAVLALFARERQRRMDQTLALSTAYRGTALLLGDIVEADDHYTGSHSRDVVDLSVAVADALGLSTAMRRNVEFAALLHDVGKIRVPKEIINKPGDLDDEEWHILRRHTVDGEQMLKQVGGILSSIGRLVRASHERYDGLGYPDGLAGDAIPIESRIVSACDAFSAMTTNRSYRPALSVEVALEELRRCAGTQFDPIVTRTLIALVKAQAARARERVAVG
jgi:hypothetical protein